MQVVTVLGSGVFTSSHLPSRSDSRLPAACNDLTEAAVFGRADAAASLAAGHESVYRPGGAESRIE